MRIRTQHVDQHGLNPIGTIRYGDLLKTLWHRRRLLLLGMAIGVGAAIAYCVLTPPQFESATQILVMRKQSNAEPVAGIASHSFQLEDQLPGHETIILSSLILESAIEIGKLDELPSMKGESDPVDALRSRLTVRNLSGTADVKNNLVTAIYYRGLDPAEGPKFVAAVSKSYTTFLGEIHEFGSEDAREIYTRWSDEVATTLSKKQKELQEMRNQASPLLARGPSGLSLSEERLNRLDKQRLELRVRRSELTEQIHSLEKAKKDGATAAVLGNMVLHFSGQTAPRSVFRERLFDLMLEEQRTIEQYGERHPEARALRDRIDLARSVASTDTIPDLPSAQADPMAAFVESVQREIDANSRIEEALIRMFDEERERIKGASDQRDRMEELASDVAHIQSLHNVIVTQLQGFNLTKSSAQYGTHVLSPPSVARRVVPNRPIALALGLFAGIAVGGFMVWRTEVRDESFRSTNDALQLADTSLACRLPMLPNSGKPRSEQSTNIQANGKSHSRELEAVRDIRSALLLAARRCGHNVIHVTSPERGDGKTTLASNLAVSIASGGQSVLLVDADLENPVLADIFGAPNTRGLTSVVADGQDVAEAIQSTEIHGLQVLTSGPPVEDDVALMSSDAFPKVISFLRDRFDFVIVDSAAMTATTSYCLAAACAGISLVVVRNNDRARLVMAHTANSLAASGVEFVGVVINECEARGCTGESVLVPFRDEGFSTRHADRLLEAAIAERAAVNLDT